MQRKLFAKLLVLFMLLPLLSVTPIKVQAASVSIIVHYHRDDGDYDKWNVWAWPLNGGGAAYPFTGQDKFGKFAEITLNNGDGFTQAGFIVRTDSWEKDTDNDRFIDLTKGNEVWVYSGQEEYFYDVPAEFAEEVPPIPQLNLSFNYSRYDGNTEGLSVKVSDPASKYIAEAKLAPSNEYDLKATVGFSNVENTRKMSFGIYSGDTLLDYAQGAFPLSKADENGNLEVYLMQGTDEIAYSPNDTGKKGSSAKFAEATLDTNTQVNIKTTKPIKPEQLNGIKLTYAGGEITEIKVETLNLGGKDGTFGTLAEGYATEFILICPALDLSHNYTVEGKLGAKQVSLGNIFGSEEFAQAFTYEGDDLGATYSKTETKFRLWAPTAGKAELLIYKEGDVTNGESPEVYEMEKAEKGTWAYTLSGDNLNKFYNFRVTIGDKVNEAVDPYAKAVGVNGRRGQIVDLAATNPANWENDKSPTFENPLDAIIYELHVRDLSTHENSGIKNVGKFLGLTETGTKNPANGLSTGLDHIKELGVTHIHLLPSFDYRSVDEAKLEENNFNWGYDPENYNTPEGSYSTNPADGNVRITEFKEMVKTLHENDLRVVMDVVYNHTGASQDSNLNLLVPDYYYRLNDNGSFANGSACGNETASERSMVRKLFVDSVVYWAKEYHVDGFRFDLMGLHDIETMNEIRAALNEVDPSIIVYGEGWTGGTSPLPDNMKAIQKNVGKKLDKNIAAFSDQIRDGIKGSVFDSKDKGFVSGAFNRVTDVMFGVVASIPHVQVKSQTEFWAAEPSQVISYASAHDNLTLWDKLITSTEADDATLRKMNKMAAAIVLTSQGTSFIHAGEEMARTKNLDENSYQSSDAVNMLDWDRKGEYTDLYEYYKGLIALRKATPAFRLRTANEIRYNIKFMKTDEGVLGYTVKDENEEYAVIFNATTSEQTIELPSEGWDVLVNGEKAGTEVLASVGTTLKATPQSSYVLKFTGATAPQEQASAEPQATADDTAQSKKNNTPIIIGAIVGGAVAALLFSFRKKGKK